MNFYRLLMFLILSFLFSEEVTQELEKFKTVPPVSNNELTSLKGEPIKFDEMYKDGPMLLSFWFLGCGPCVAEMKHLSKFNEKYKDTGFRVISINTDTRNKGKVKSFVKKKKYSFDMLFDVNGKNGLIKKLGGSVCPFTALINMDGTIYSKHIGYERGDEIALEKEILEFIDYNKKIKDSSTMIDGIPSWFMDTPQEEGYVYVAGTGTSRMMQNAVMKATLNAQAQLNQSGTTTTTTTTTTIDDDGIQKTNTISTYESSYSGELQFHVLKKHVKEEEGVYRAYILLRVKEISEDSNN